MSKLRAVVDKKREEDSQIPPEPKDDKPVIQQRFERARLKGQRALDADDLEKELAQLKAQQSPTLVPLKDLHPHPKNSEMYSIERDPALEESLVFNGLIDPLVVCEHDGQYRIISGHRRHFHLLIDEIQARIEYHRLSRIESVPVRNLGIIDELEQELLLVAFNRHRVKTFVEKMREAEVLEEAYRKGAWIRKVSGTDNLTLNLVDGTRSHKETADRVAKEVFGVSKDTYKKFKKIVEYAKAQSSDWTKHRFIQALQKGAKADGVIKTMEEARATRWDEGISSEAAIAFGEKIYLRVDYSGMSSQELKLLAKFHAIKSKDTLDLLKSLDKA